MGTSTPHLMVIAGEVSGDMHAANLVRELTRCLPDLRLSGIGGPRLEACGMTVHYHTRDMAVLGLWEVIKRYGFFRRVFKDMVRRVQADRPDAVLLVDYPGFNLRFARELHRQGIKVLYYICPQVWAWHRSRIPAMARILDRLMVIFPFEVEVFEGTGLTVDYVGHPLVDDTRSTLAAPSAELPWPGPVPVALLPGSRRQEVERLLPAMLHAAALLEAERDDLGFLVAAASPEIEILCQRLLDTQPPGHAPKNIRILAGHTRDIVRQARAAWVTSGTATIETALLGCPMVVVYRTAWLTYEIGRRVIQVSHLGMVNLIAGREVCPERLQHDVTGPNLAQSLRPLIDNTPERNTMITDLNHVRDQLGDGGGARRAADIVHAELTHVAGGRS